MSSKNKALDDLIKAQVTLGDLGFTLLPNNTYYKDYGLVNGGIVRIVPIFDKSISLAKEYSLVALEIVDYDRIEINSNEPIALEKFPMECMEDVTSILARLVPEVAMAQRKQTFIINADCSECKRNVHSFIKLGDVVTCLPCFGLEDLQSK